MGTFKVRWNAGFIMYVHEPMENKGRKWWFEREISHTGSGIWSLFGANVDRSYVTISQSVEPLWNRHIMWG